jgi:hypothetical protein
LGTSNREGVNMYGPSDKDLLFMACLIAVAGWAVIEGVLWLIRLLSLTNHAKSPDQNRSSKKGGMMRECKECGMSVEPGEYHPYAACLMFKAWHMYVRSNCL